MIHVVRAIHTAQRRLAICVLCVGVFSLVGCASLSPASDAGGVNASPDQTALRERATRRLALASAYFESAQIDVAEQEVRAALQIDPHFAQAYGLLALIQQRNNALPLADQSFQQALANLPSQAADLADIEHNYGWFLCQQDKFEASQVQFDHALAQPSYRQKSKTFMVKGLCQLRAKQPEAARNSFKQALGITPNNPVARYSLARLDWQEGHTREAQAVLLPLNQGEQANAESLWLGIQLSHALKQTREMAMLAKRLTTQFPDSTQAQLWEQKKFED